MCCMIGEIAVEPDYRLQDSKRISAGRLRSNRAMRDDRHAFALDPEQLSDARWQIQLHISALDRLEQMLVSQALSRLDLKVFRTNRCKSATQRLCNGSLPVEDANNIREGRILY